jgi:hypothetical protein
MGADEGRGSLTLVAVDVADDLAVVRLDHPGPAMFEFDERALDGSIAKGEELYSLGNPLDIGFSIVEGTYNGPVERNYQERLHFSGAINPGMSGGPTVDADGKVVGVNVSKQINGELVSFLVPARYAAALLEKARSGAPPAPSSFKDEVGRQLIAFQKDLYKQVDDAGFKPSSFGPYQAPESPLPWFTCWGGTNADKTPAPRFSANSASCYSSTGLYVASDLGTGSVWIGHSYLKSVDLNSFQFASVLAQASQPPGAQYVRKWHTHAECREDFVQSEPAAEHPKLRVVWCAKAYRKFEGLYDIAVVAATEDRPREALVSRLNLQGVSYENALGLTRRFLDGIRWNR